MIPEFAADRLDVAAKRAEIHVGTASKAEASNGDEPVGARRLTRPLAKQSHRRFRLPKKSEPTKPILPSGLIARANSC
jgi:hypothetical protein